MSRILLTGATGFIGRHVLPLLLSRGHEVHAVSRTPSPHKVAEGCHWHCLDLLDADQAAAAALMSMVRPERWLHLAWYAEPGKYWQSPENFRWVQASLNLLHAFGEAGGERVVMAGSCAEYDWEYGYCREAMTPLRPTTRYGTTKHALQLMLSSYAASAGISAAWGRVFFLYGPGEYPQRLVPTVIRSLLAGETADCTKGEQIRDFLHVEDVAGAFVTLLESAHGGPINIGSGKPLSVRELANTVAAQIGRSELLRLGALPTPPGEPRLLVADPSLLEQLGWSPQYQLDEGIEQTIRWWREQGS